MAVQVFEIKWDGLFTIEDAIKNPVARGRGIYICYKTTSGKGNPKYIGKSAKLNDRLRGHKQGIQRFSKDDLTKATYALGEILNYSGDRVSPSITDPQLGNIETFLINKVPNENPSKPPYKGKDNIIIVNTGKTFSLESIISHNPATLELLIKGIRSKKAKQAKTKRDPLFYVGKI